MIRNLKALGLALVAVVAISVMAASAASAATPGEMTVGAGTQNVTATEIAAGVNRFTMFGNSLECPGSNYSIWKYNSTLPEEPVPNAVTTVTAFPNFKQSACKSGLGTKATVTVNSCDFVFHVGETTGGGETYAVTADVVCPGLVEVDMHFYASAANENIVVCTVNFGTQSGLTGTAHLTNGVAPSGKKDVTLSGIFKGLHVIETGLCGNKTETGGEFHISATFQGTNGAGAATDFFVTD
jgi:hypothetical protein